MGKNLIHNYIANTSNTTPQELKPQKSERSYFQIPTMGTTLDSFDKETDKLIKPLDGRGHLVNDSLLDAPREFVRELLSFFMASQMEESIPETTLVS